MISVRGKVSSFWSGNPRLRTSWTPSVCAARRVCSGWPTPFGPYRSDSPSHTMTAVTQSPARACSATVPPHPSSSSSGCAATTRIRLGISPDPSGPLPLGEVAPLEDLAVVGLELEQQHGPRATCHELPAGALHRADHRPEHLAGLPSGPPGVGKEGDLPDAPPPALEPTERTGVGLRQGAHEVVECFAAFRPIDLSVGRAAPWQDRLVDVRLRSTPPLSGEELRQDAQDHVAVGCRDAVEIGRASCRERG